MLLVCKSCGNYFESVLIIDGKSRKLHNRKHCLNCSPFNGHNTRPLVEGVRPGFTEVCLNCGRKLPDLRRRICAGCFSEKYRTDREELIKRVVGTCCSVCGYDGASRWQVMDFHHIDPTTKLFGISKRELKRPWSILKAEIKKCLLVCCRCHREITYGFITEEEVMLYYERFQESIVEELSNVA